jgi:hypothetical protein
VYCSMDPSGISLGTFYVHAFPCASMFNTFGVYLALACMLHSGKLLIQSGYWQFFYALKKYPEPIFPFNIISLTQM